jgi:hypothetical protein
MQGQQLADLQGAVPWSLLTSVKVRKVGTRLLPDYPQNVKSLNNTTVKVQGFMMPLEPGEKQRHFLVTNVPVTCSFCIPSGPEALIEVKAKAPVRYQIEPVVLEGKLAVLADDKTGLYYRLSDAQVSTISTIKN